MQPLKSLAFALALVGCASQGSDPDTLAPAPSALHSEFNAVDADNTMYGPFVAATLAQQNEQHASAAHYFLQALNADPESGFVADRAFFQLVYAGRMDEAAALAVKMQHSENPVEDDLLHLMYVLEAYQQENWAEVRERLAEQQGAGYGFLITPILSAWSYAAEDDRVAASKALAPLINDPRLGVIGQEHYAYILDHLGRYDAASAAYQTLASDERPASLQPLVAYADMLTRTGKEQQAREFLGEQTKRFGDNRFLLREGMRITGGFGPSQDATNPRGAAGLVFYRLATEFAQSQSQQAAIVYLRVASYLTPEVSEIYFLLGNLLEQIDTPESAVAAYGAVPQTSPLKPLAELRRIGALRSAGRDDEAEALLRAALRDAPKSSAHLSALADLLCDEEKFEEAVHYYSQAIGQIRSAQQSDWFIFFARGVCYERLGNWQQAEADLKTALQLNPGEASVLNYLGYSWIDRGENIDEAKAMIEQAVAEQPDDGFIVDSLGWVHYLTGDYLAAVEYLEKAVRLEPTDPTINDHLGDAYWRVGRKIEARFQWRHAMDNSPSDDERKSLLEKLELGLEEPS